MPNNVQIYLHKRTHRFRMPHSRSRSDVNPALEFISHTLLTISYNMLVDGGATNGGKSPNWFGFAFWWFSRKIPTKQQSKIMKHPGQTSQKLWKIPTTLEIPKQFSNIGNPARLVGWTGRMRNRIRPINEAGTARRPLEKQRRDGRRPRTRFPRRPRGPRRIFFGFKNKKNRARANERLSAVRPTVSAGEDIRTPLKRRGRSNADLI